MVLFCKGKLGHFLVINWALQMQLKCREPWVSAILSAPYFTAIPGRSKFCWNSGNSVLTLTKELEWNRSLTFEHVPSKHSWVPMTPLDASAFSAWQCRCIQIEISKCIVLVALWRVLRLWMARQSHWNKKGKLVFGNTQSLIWHITAIIWCVFHY